MKKRLLSWFLAIVMVFGLLPMTAWAEETVPFTATAGGTTLSVEKCKEQYNYTKWDGSVIGPVALYEVTVPSNIEIVTLDFGVAEVLAYGYDENDQYVTAYGDYDDAKTGKTDAIVAEEYLGYYVQVQTPYDDSWNNELLYAITFNVENEMFPFSANTAEMPLKVEVAEETYSYTKWDGSVIGPVTLYEVTVPANSEVVTLNFGTAEVLAYGYDKNDQYVTAYGDYGDAKTGKTTAIIEDVYFEYYVQVQTPYDDSWNNELLYAIHLLEEDSDETETPEGEVSINELLKNIAASYQEKSDDGWKLLELIAYKDLNLGSEKTTDEARQKYLNSAIADTAAGTGSDKNYSEIILTLTAMGIDAEQLYPLDSETPVNALECLRYTSSSDIWGDAFKLMALSQKDKATVDETEKALLKSLIDRQRENGSWIRSGDPIQTTSIVLNALAFYKEYTYEDETGEKIAVEDIIVDAVDYLKGAQQEDGSFVDGNAADANTAAMLVVGLAAAGEDPAEFGGKNSITALDALLQFALKDNSGFGYTNASVWNEMATEQAFRALIAASQIMETGEAFNIYDFSHNAGSLVPGYAVEVEEETPTTPSRPSHKDDNITVEVSIKAIDEYWMRNKDVTIDEDSTVYDAFMEVIDGSDIEQEGAEDGYIESMTKDGETLGEFDYGDNSGWMYKVNDERPDVGIRSYELEDGDEILFYYVEDWTEDEDADFRDQDKEEEVKEEEIQEELKEEPVEEEPVEKIPVGAIFTDITEENAYYDAVQWAVDHKITSGVTETVFGADGACSRGQMITFLWRMMGSPAPETKVAPYIDVVAENYYHDAILWATENDFANGVDGISFRPEMALTRGQAVTFLWRAAGMPEPVGENSFVDVSETEYYYKAVLWAAENGITFGTGDNGFSPDVPCTRGQIVTFLYRYFGK